MAIQNDNTILSKGDLKAYHEAIAPLLGGTFMVSTNNSDYYSTDEKVVGVWTDGKPVYQRTVFFNPVMSVSSTAWSATSIDVSNVDNIINGEGYSVDGSKQSRPMSFFLDGVLKIMSGRDNIGSDGISGVTYRYTKTTDTAGSAATTPGAYDINFPNTWPANKEVYFGNGVYGYRKTGTITAASDTRAITVFDSSIKTAKIINSGGYYTTVDAEYITLGAYPSGKNTLYKMSMIASNSETGLFLVSIDNGARSNSPYDVWVTYTK